MSYCLEYNPELGKQYPPVRKNRRTFPVSYLFIGLGVMVLCYVLIGLGWMRYLIPGDPQVTVTAWKEMVSHIGAGEPVGESVHTFFTYVIAHGA